MKRKIKWMMVLIIIMLATIFSYTQNNWITTTSFSLSSSQLPESFDGFKVVHLSDLHSKSFGENQSRLVRRIVIENPNLIFFTGDLVDARNYDLEKSMALMEALVKIAPTYYVTGNHEWNSKRFKELELSLRSVGIHVLRNEKKTFTQNGEDIYLIGIDDPTFMSGSINENIQQSLKGLQQEDYTILLSHRPELFEIYQNNFIDLTFSGHAHGGQIRIPFVGGIIAPNQGVFPKYTEGKYVENDSVLFVNRGLGNSIIPQRIFNRPEVISVTLTRELEGT